MNAFLAAALALVLVLAGGLAAVVAVRSRMRTADDRAVWEGMLTDYRNLRDQGVLSEEEYRNIRHLVEPRMRDGGPAGRGRHRPLPHASGPEHGRN